MADWCYNRLTISGDSARVVAAVDGIRGHYSDGSECLFAFERVLPPPSGVADRGAWCYDNWGTERYPIDCCIDRSSDRFALEFQTAYGPAKGAVAALAAQHPDLRFIHEYDFDAFAYGGRLDYDGGQLVEEDYWDHEDDEDDDEGATPDEAASPAFDLAAHDRWVDRRLDEVFKRGDEYVCPGCGESIDIVFDVRRSDDEVDYLRVSPESPTCSGFVEIWTHWRDDAHFDEVGEQLAATCRGQVYACKGCGQVFYSWPDGGVCDLCGDVVPPPPPGPLARPSGLAE